MNNYPHILIVFSWQSFVLLLSMLGIIGDSNTKCINPPSALSSVQSAEWGELGSKCNANDECMYGDCSENVCVAPPLLCPTNSAGEYMFYPVILTSSSHFSYSLLRLTTSSRHLPSPSHLLSPLDHVTNQALYVLERASVVISIPLASPLRYALS